MSQISTCRHFSPENPASFPHSSPPPQPGDSLLSSFKSGSLTGVMDACATGRLLGTSMSAPVVAGAATLVRQYFQAGYYPSGERGRGRPRIGRESIG